MESVVVRFAPSPTGDLHLGGARTALFNYLFARSQGGRFLLRIEDTDRERSTEEFTRVILEGMTWLGLDWDGEPIHQSQRSSLYQAALESLVADGKAYYCHCTREELAARREEAQRSGGAWRYDRRCREKDLPGEGGVLRLAAPLEGETRFTDVLRGEVVFQNAELDDFVLARAGGEPLYNLCVVVDDHEMGITHVLRGDDHIANTPRQVLLYQALELPVPLFGHFPMICGSDGGRLSKRHGATSILAYREMGLLPEGMMNYLARLSWGSGDQEIFSHPELVELFSLKGISLSPAVFDTTKLEWVNAQHMKKLDPAELARRALPWLEQAGYAPDFGDPLLPRLMSQISERAKNLKEIPDWTAFYFQEPDGYDPKGDRKFLKEPAADLLEELIPLLESCRPFEPEPLEQAITAFLEARELKLGKLGQPIRLALTGQTRSPGLFDLIHLVGRERTAARIRRTVAHIRSKPPAGG